MHTNFFYHFWWCHRGKCVSLSYLQLWSCAFDSCKLHHSRLGELKEKTGNNNGGNKVHQLYSNRIVYFQAFGLFCVGRSGFWSELWSWWFLICFEIWLSLRCGGSAHIKMSYDLILSGDILLSELNETKLNKRVYSWREFFERKKPMTDTQNWFAPLYAPQPFLFFGC